MGLIKEIGYTRNNFWVALIISLPVWFIIFGPYSKLDNYTAKFGFAIVVLILAFYITFLWRMGVWGVKRMKRLFAEIVPDTQASREARNLQYQGSKISFFLGILMFSVIWNFFVLGGIAFGYHLLFGDYFVDISLENLGVFFLDLFRPETEDQVAMSIVFFLIFFFAFMYGRAYALADPVLLKEKKVSPIFVFNRAMISWFTLGEGEKMRHADFRFSYGKVIFKLVLAFIFAWMLDLFRDEIFATPILTVMVFVYEFFMVVYRIDRK